MLFYIQENLTVLTGIINWIGQLDDCYVIDDCAWVLPTVDDHVG